MRRVTTAIVLGMALAGVPGCFDVNVRDSRTIAALERTITAREADFARWRRELEVPTPTARDLRGLDVVERAELDRLRAWLEYERAKAERP